MHRGRPVTIRLKSSVEYLYSL